MITFLEFEFGCILPACVHLTLPVLNAKETCINTTQGAYEKLGLSLNIWLRAVPRQSHHRSLNSSRSVNFSNAVDRSSPSGRQQGRGSNNGTAAQPQHSSQQGQTFDIKGFAFMFDNVTLSNRTAEELRIFLKGLGTSHAVQSSTLLHLTCIALSWKREILTGCRELGGPS